MKKVLILAYDFPPYVSVGGLRPYNWFKYFKDFGFEPIVVTRQWDNEFGNELDYIVPSKSKNTIIEKTEYGTIIRTPYSPNFPNRLYLKYGSNKFRLIRKICSLYFEITQYIWHTGTKKDIYKAADNYLKNEKVNVIIATADPYVLFHFASKLSKKYNTPWIADYRDPWSFGLGMGNPIYKAWNRFLEKKTLKNVYEITTVNNTFIQNLKTITSKKIHLLPNGYDPEIIEPLVLKNDKNKIFTISFIGTMHKWNPYELFLKVLNDLISVIGTDKVILNFFGINNADEIASLIENRFTHLKDVVNITPKLPNEKVLELASKSHLFLLFNYYSVIGTKIYDYIGLRIPILFCFSEEIQALELQKKYYNTNDYEGMANNIQQQVIEKQNAGIIVKDANHLIEVLKNCFEEFQKNGDIKSKTLYSEKFSRKYQIKNLADIIKDIK